MPAVRRVIAAAVSASAVAVAVAVVPSLGSTQEANKPAGPRTSSESPTPELLPCTAEDAPTNFEAFSVGPEFEGLALTGQERRCTHAPPGAPPQARINVVQYFYGTCDPPPDGGCSLPLVVQNWPRCERGPVPSHGHNPVHGKVSIRGVPARQYEGGRRLEVYTGESTVVVFGTNPARVLRTGRALVKAPARPTSRVVEGDTSRELPPPPSGRIPCA